MRLEGWRGFQESIAREVGSTVIGLPTLDSLRRRKPRPSIEEQFGIAPQAIDKDLFKIRLANKKGIRQEACMLVDDRYAQRGYGAQKTDVDPNCLAIAAYDGSKVIGTLSIGLDSAQGLRCDQLYRREVDELRASGARVCEFVKFAAKPSSASINIVAALFHVAFIYAHRIHGFDDVVMEVTPQHLKFYKRALGFRQLGKEGLNPRVNTVGVLSHCKFEYIAEQLLRFGGNIGMRKTEKSLYPYGFSPAEEQGIVKRIYALHR